MHKTYTARHFAFYGRGKCRYRPRHIRNIDHLLTHRYTQIHIILTATVQLNLGQPVVSWFTISTDLCP